ncbi:MAG: hypothetical protein ACREJC_15005, partial [Tepidisphaeraceae bacterium]
MLEVFLILLAAGIMLATAISSPRDVTLNWLRLAGIIALACAGTASFWFFLRASDSTAARVLLGASVMAILAQLGLVQLAWRNGQRACAVVACALGIACGALLLHLEPGASDRRLWCEALGAFGAASVCGLALMDMLLGHAYLTASKLAIAPFRRLNLALAIALAVQIVTSIVIAHFVNQSRPVDRLWGIHGLYIATRWFLGLLVPAVFVYMADDCIKRRSTQSATGILYVTG